jgi:pseudo-rSAM protein
MNETRSLRKEINCDERYWICIEPFVFIFKGIDEYILYNSLSYTTLKVKINENKMISNMLEHFMEMDNLYSFLITGYQIIESNLQDFIMQLRSGYYGDIFPFDFFPKKPAILPPVSNIKNSIENIKKDTELQRRETYLNFFHEVTIYINGNCNLNCSYCDKYLKQFLFCSKSDFQFSLEDISLLFGLLSNTYVSKINITGGNPFLYKHLNILLSGLENFHSIKAIYIHYSNIDSNELKSVLQLSNLFVHMLIPCPIDKERIDILYQDTEEYGHLIVWEFIASSEKDMDDIQRIVDLYKLNSYTVKPFFNENMDFFEANVFNDLNDILDAELGSEDIFARQSLNLYDYGKL